MFCGPIFAGTTSTTQCANSKRVSVVLVDSIRPTAEPRDPAMALYRDTGVVLRTWKLGEADRIVSVFTREHGKVRGVAKGVRKSGSRFGSRLEPTCHVSLQLYKGKGDLDTITQVELIERPETVRGDYDLWVRASAMLEAVDHMTIDREPNEVMFDMLVRALRTLAARRGPLVAPAFFLKL